MSTHDPLGTANVPSRAPLDYYGLALTDVASAGSTTEPDIARAARAMAREGDRVLVGGGGVGTVSALLAYDLGTHAVWTVEPNPEMVALMRGNISVAGQPLHIEEAALWSSDGTMELALGDFWGNASLVRHDFGDTRQVRTVDTNAFVRRHRLTVLCLDIEGAEDEVMAHLDLGPIRALVVELHEGVNVAMMLNRLVPLFGSVHCLPNHGPAGFLLAAERP